MLVNLVAFSFVLITATNADDVTPTVHHLELNGIHLFDTSDSNYAITALSFIDKGWLTASFNGDQVTFMTPTCQTDIKNVEAMNEDERATLKEAYSKVITVDAEDQPTDGRTRASSSRFALDGSWWWFTSRTVGVMRFSMSDYSFCKNDDNNFTAAKSSLPNNIARVFVHNDLVTFVYRDLKVTMKPISCLDDDEGNLLDDLEKLIRKQLKERPEEEEDEISKPEKIEEPAGR